MREPVRVGPSAEYPVSTATLAAQVRSDGDEEVLLLDIYLAAAVAHVEDRTGRAIAATEWKQSFDGFPSGAFKVPFGPVLPDSVVVRYLDAGGVDRTIDAVDLIVDASSVEASVSSAPGAWPATNDRIANVTLSWVAQSEVCPPGLVVAVLMLAAHWYRQRESVVIGTTSAEVPMAVESLIAAQRRFKG